MKKFRIIKIIFSILIVILAVIYIFFIRNNNVSSSKSYNFFNSLNYISNKQITMKLNYEDDVLYSQIIFASDYKEEKEVHIFDTYYKNDKTNHGISILSKTKNGSENIVLFPEEKYYKKLIDINNKTKVYDEWYLMFENLIVNSSYYIRKFELINGKILYCEEFKESGLKLYYDKNNLVYLKSKGIENSFSNINNSIYSVKITFDNYYKEFINIPDDFKEIN